MAAELMIDAGEITGYELLKRSIDARGREPKYVLKFKIFAKEPFIPKIIPGFEAHDVSKSKHVVIVGAGPAGLFAALQLIEAGIKPIIIERGKNVRERRRDLALITKQGIVNPESNYCFGEGGAGTYSDGKLYTRSTKRGDVNRILELLVAHGADRTILADAHPHIGTNKLPQIIVAIRDNIIRCGGEVHFNAKLTDIKVKNNCVSAVVVNGENEIETSELILATGHSARDIYYLLHEKNIEIEYKPFAMGVRAEHPQTLIDAIQYKCKSRGEYLPPAAYSLVEQVQGLGVYSFCMCPGGIIAPCATAPGEIVTNGWSPSKRNNPFANSGIVVSVDEKDIARFKEFGPLAGLKFQEEVEKNCFVKGGNDLFAPAQRMVDFCENKFSATLPDCSYHPGIRSAKLTEVLPFNIYSRLQKAFKEFGKKMPARAGTGGMGYYTNEAVLVAVESRTSSPVRIPRDKESLEHTQIKGLYPCGEGAGFAGGIISAAIDGQNIAVKIAMKTGK